MLNEFVAAVNGVLWSHVLVYLLIIAGLWFTIRLGFIQFRSVGHMFSLLRTSRGSDASGISSFQALCTSLSARVGTGNLAGVAIAISLGGPGAVFWMWVIALLGMATAFAESTLAQVYKVRDRNGEFRGGPAYYIKQGLNQSWLAVLFSVSLLFGYVCVFSATQANTIADALNHSFAIPEGTTAIALVVIAGFIVVGGLRSIARFSELVVPLMSFAFVITALGITIINIAEVPRLLSLIVSSAFGMQEAGAGTFAAALKIGIQRGLFSNEAGAGSVPQAAASASPKPNHPVVQGYIQMLGVFIDTLVICSCTAVVILLAGDLAEGTTEGIAITQAAMSAHLGWFGGYFVAIAITLFGFTSIVANYAYAESNLHFFGLDSKVGRATFTAIFLGMMFLGTKLELKTMWATADMAFGFMTLINVIAILALSPTVVALLKNYQRGKNSQELSFSPRDCDIQGQTEKGIWH
ncbi:MAG: alanine:cation symporter family protein [Arenicella sp.]|nr:alanine:cation symporter family protein [Arenicella sp.]